MKSVLVTNTHFLGLLTLSSPGGRGGGGVPALISTFENFLAISNTYETLPLLLKIIGEQDSVIFFVNTMNSFRVMGRGHFPSQITYKVNQLREIVDFLTLRQRISNSFEEIVN